MYYFPDVNADLSFKDSPSPGAEEGLSLEPQLAIDNYILVDYYNKNNP